MGIIDMLAFVAVVMPSTWIQLGHELAGLGEFPAAPIAGYLARSASALYGLHGMIVFYISFRVARYWGLIRFMATLALFHGLVMLAIDLAEGMPIWWTILEGPAFTSTGAGVLLAQYLSQARFKGEGLADDPE